MGVRVHFPAVASLRGSPRRRCRRFRVFEGRIDGPREIAAALVVAAALGPARAPSGRPPAPPPAEPRIGEVRGHSRCRGGGIHRGGTAAAARGGVRAARAPADGPGAAAVRAARKGPDLLEGDQQGGRDAGHLGRPGVLRLVGAGEFRRAAPGSGRARFVRHPRDAPDPRRGRPPPGPRRLAPGGRGTGGGHDRGGRLDQLLAGGLRGRRRENGTRGVPGEAGRDPGPRFIAGVGSLRCFGAGSSPAAPGRGRRRKRRGRARLRFPGGGARRPASLGDGQEGIARSPPDRGTPGAVVAARSGGRPGPRGAPAAAPAAVVGVPPGLGSVHPADGRRVAGGGHRGEASLRPGLGKDAGVVADQNQSGVGRAGARIERASGIPLGASAVVLFVVVVVFVVFVVPVGVGAVGGAVGGAVDDAVGGAVDDAVGGDAVSCGCVVVPRATPGLGL